MRVTFARTGPRRYRVTAEREAFPPAAIEPAPGYDDHLPHDLVHLLVERHWQLRAGIYGDLAAGGDAGTFLPTEERRDKKYAKKHGGLATTGADMDRSEALALAAFAHWQGHTGNVPPNSEYARTTAAAARATSEELAALMPTLDEAAARWHALKPGDSISYDWPETTSRPHRAPAKSRAR